MGNIICDIKDRYPEWVFDKMKETLSTCINRTLGEIREDIATRPVDISSDVDFLKDVKPVYTQEMCDNDELPSIGMEVLVDDCNGCGMYIDVEVMYISDSICVINDGNNDHSFCPKTCKISPSTKAIELIDGKAYQFHYGNSERVGFYNVADDHFYDNKSFEAATSHINMCTNIVPLVPEVK